MDVSDMIAAYRDESHDIAKPPFMSDDRLLALANEGQIEACRRAGLLRTSTADVCSASITAGDPMVQLDAKILDVVRARASTGPYPLAVALTLDLDNQVPDWEASSGEPTDYVPDYESGWLRLYPVPVKDGELRMTVTRLPRLLESDSDTPEIRTEHHPALVQWMLHRAFGTQDSDLFDPNRSGIALAAFEREFGKKKSARNEAWQRERNDLTSSPIA